MQVSNDIKEETLSKVDRVKAAKKELVAKIKDKNRDPNCFFANYLERYHREKLIKLMME